jgi:hypothetical protein
MLTRLKNNADALFFNPGDLFRETARISSDPIGEIADMKGVPFMLRIFSSGAALTSGMQENLKNSHKKPVFG